MRTPMSSRAPVIQTKPAMNGSMQELKREPVISRLHPSRLSELLQGLTTMQVLEFLDEVRRFLAEDEE